MVVGEQRRQRQFAVERGDGLGNPLDVGEPAATGSRSRSRVADWRATGPHELITMNVRWPPERACREATGPPTPARNVRSTEDGAWTDVREPTQTALNRPLNGPEILEEPSTPFRPARTPCSRLLPIPST